MIENVRLTPEGKATAQKITALYMMGVSVKGIANTLGLSLRQVQFLMAVEARSE